MSWAVSVTQQTYESEALITYQYQLTEITNALLALSRESGAVYDEQNAAVQAYASGERDVEGVAAFDYINSSAFTLPFEQRLKEIHIKEQKLEQDKIQVETKIKELQTNLEDWEKAANKNAENIFGYMSR